jgi:hypothetical protein
MSATQEAEIARGLQFEASVGKKLVRPHLNQQAKHNGVCLSSGCVGGIYPAQTCELNLKNNKSKKG